MKSVEVPATGNLSNWKLGSFTGAPSVGEMLTFWKGVLAIVLWPYFLGSFFAR
jgi:hypothetical protein